MVEQIYDLCICEEVINVPEQLFVITAVTRYAGRQPARSEGAAHVRVAPRGKEKGAQPAYRNLLPSLELQEQCVGARAPRHRLQFGPSLRFQAYINSKRAVKCRSKGGS